MLIDCPLRNDKILSTLEVQQDTTSVRVGRRARVVGDDDGFEICSLSTGQRSLWC